LFATDTNSGTNNNSSCTNNGKDRHLFYNFGFSGLTGTIQGIQVRLDARADSTSASPKICVEISWNGGTAYTWSRIWGLGDFSNANFRIRVTDVAGNGNRDFFLDYLAVNVTYQP
jgi:hypothetical protein